MKWKIWIVLQAARA